MSVDAEQKPSTQVDYTIYLIRHAEKESGTDDPGLTNKGKERAKSLVKFFADKNLQNIYSTNYKRTFQTALPVAKQLSLDVNYYNPRELQAFSKQLLSKKENTLIVGHSNTTPLLIKYLSGKSVAAINENQHNRLFQITIKSSDVELIELDMD